MTNTWNDPIRRRSAQIGRGRAAERPSDIPYRGWMDVAWRMIGEMSEDRVMLIAAGVTYYFLLALFPGLAAFVSLYGFVADPGTVAEHIAFLGGLLPSTSMELIRSQLQSLAGQNSDALSVGFVFGLLIALWSANNGIKALFQAMNVAYGETEKRGFFKVNLLSFAFTLGAIVIGILFIVTVGVVPAVLAMLRLEDWMSFLVKVLRWPVVLVAVAIGITLIYRFAPSREKAKWRWLTWGAAISTLVWVAASVGFSIYLENFADYNATYGTLGAAIGLMVWTWISVVILIVGARLNAELEHQTALDTTTGTPLPIGDRGAVVADAVGRSSDEKS